MFVHATRNLAAERQTIVLIDDLHFAPEDARSLFMTLALAVPGHQVLLVGTMRPGVDETWVSSLTRLDQAAQASLSRLGPKDLSSLLLDAFKSERLAQELGLRIAQKSDGNPFFAFEIIQGLREGQFITQQPDGTWISTQVIEDIQIPSSVMDLIQARMADLSEEERELLDVASCCGFEFDGTLVAEVLGKKRIPTFRRLGRIERQQRLVRSSGRNHVFDHHQIQEALYDGLAEVLREEYHAAIAEAVETRESTDVKDSRELDGALCVDLCDHHLKGAQGEKALRYLHPALDYLEASYLNGHAVTLCDRVLDTPGLVQDEKRLAVLLRKNERLDPLGRRSAQEEVLQLAQSLAERLDSPSSTAKVEKATGSLLWALGHFEDSQRHFSKQLAIARELGDLQEEAEAEGGIGVALFRLDEYEAAMEHQKRSLACAQETGDRRTATSAMLNLGNCLKSLGRHSEARTYYERVVELAGATGLGGYLATAVGNLGNLLNQLGEYEQAKPNQEKQIALARDHGNRQSEAIASVNLGATLGGLERHVDAIARYERGLDVSREIGDRNLEGLALANRGHSWRSLGEHSRAEESLTAALAVCRDIGARRYESWVIDGLSLVAHDRGDADGALSLAKEALSIRREIGAIDDIAHSLILIGELALGDGNMTAAYEALREAEALSRSTGHKNQISRATALLACLPDGDPEEAEAALRDAGDSGDMPRIRYHLWRATGNHEHLNEAKRLLDQAVEHTPEEYRESMLTNVRLHRDIMEAWKAHKAAEA